MDNTHDYEGGQTDEKMGIHVLFKGVAQGKVVQSVAWEGFNGNGNPMVIHEKPYLEKRQLLFFFADPYFPLSLFQAISFFIQDIIVWLADFKIGVGDIIVDDFSPHHIR